MHFLILFFFWFNCGLLGAALGKWASKRPIKFEAEDIRVSFYLAAILIGARVAAEYLM